MFKRRCGACVAERPLHGDDVAAGGDEPAGVKVAHVVEPDGFSDASPLSEHSPAVIHCVRVAAVGVCLTREDSSPPRCPL